MLLILYGILILAGLLNFFLFNGEKKLRYRNWYKPWLVTLLAFVAMYYYPKSEPIITSYFPTLTYGISIVFVIAFYISWLIIKKLLDIFQIDDLMEKWLKKNNSSKALSNRGFKNYLLWPYFISNFDIYYKPGHKFYKWLFRLALFFVIFVYYWTVSNEDSSSLFYIPTGIGLITGIIFIEWLLYFDCSVSKELGGDDIEIDENERVRFYNLFKRYTNSEHGFSDSIIFAYIKNRKNDINKPKENNDEYIKNYIDNFKAGKDFIVSTDDYLIAVPKFSEIFFDTIKKGGNILILTDILEHTKFSPAEVGISSDYNNTLESAAKIFSEYLERTIEHEIPPARELLKIGFFDRVHKGDLNRRLVMTGIEDAMDDALIHSDWIKELDLVVFMQFDDVYANNLLTKRKFSLWLDQQQIKYKKVLFNTFRTSGDEALTNTWMTTINPSEAKIAITPESRQQYYINFAYEKSHLNLNRILKGNTHQFDLSPGIELSVFAIMENIKHIHFLESYQQDYIQSRNKLASVQSAFIGSTDPKDLYNYKDKVSQTKIEKAIVVNNLPFIVRDIEKHPYCESKHLSIIYDIENNAPKMYKKYRHLGNEESFVCIVSKPHLFREFFAEQLHYFKDATLEAIEPQLSKANINLCLQLFHLMKHEDIDVNYILYLINLHSINMKDVFVIDFIRDLFKRYLHLDSTTNSVIKSQQKLIFDKGKYTEILSLNIDKQELSTNIIFDYLENVKILDNSRNLLMEIPKYLLFQNILPQQNIIINGSSFQYNHYDQESKELILSAVATDNRTFYKPVAKLTFIDKDFLSIDTSKVINFTVKGDYYKFSSQILEREMEISYTRYYKFENEYHSPFSPKEKSQYIDLTTIDNIIDISKRKYITRYLKLQWDLSKEFVDKKDEITTALHILLYEFMPVLFPYRHQYIQVVSDNALKPKIRNYLPWIFAEHNIEISSENKIEIYIVEDSFSDLGILKAIQNHLEYIIKNLYDLLIWIKDDSNCYVSDYMEYVKGKSFYKDKLQFLKYGLSANQIPWDINLLLRFIKQNAFFNTDTINDNHQRRCVNSDNSIEVTCDYCEKIFDISKVQVMEDGLHRCMSCSESAIDTFEQAKEVEKKAHELYKKILKIDFEKENITYDFRFVTATELHQYYNKPFYVTNQYDKRVAIGLASDREIDMIHVEKFWKEIETLSIVIHELMHIIQYQMLNYFKLKNKEPLLVEGMTTWAQYYILSNSKNPKYIAFAKKLDKQFKADSSIYGKSYRYIQKKYGKNTFEKLYKKYKL